MSAAAILPRPASETDEALRRFGEWLLRRQAAIRALQWTVVGLYLVLVAVPAFLPLPPREAHIWSNLTLAAQFAFWGVWWPFVIASMALVGRLWCGLLCPEGTLTEAASRWSLGRAVPRWMRWRGWPLAAFGLTTVYGQMASVYQYPRPVLVVLGGSTLAAIGIGLLYGRDKRVWCRFLCPVNGVFALVAKLAPVHFAVDRAAWAASPRPARSEAPNCAPLVPIRTMRGAGACHMCGRCSGYRGAVRLARRSPSREIVEVAGTETDPWQTALILFGLIGLAGAAFGWTSSPLFVELKQVAAEHLVGAGWAGLLDLTLPWWILTDYPAENDVMTVLDGAVLLLFLGGSALGFGLGLAGCAAGATLALGRWSARRFHHLVQALIPVAAAGLFIGLSSLTVGLLHAEGLDVPHLAALRAGFVTAAGAWSVYLSWRIAGLYAPSGRQLVATAAMICAIGLAAFGSFPVHLG